MKNTFFIFINQNYFRKRYFICPPNTGIFILTIKLLKQQHYLALNNRPSTPHQTTIKTTQHTNSIPPLPKKVILPSKDNENDELIKKLQQENKLLKQSNQHLEQTIKEIKSASMNSIEILENLITTHQTKINELEKDLKNERLKYNELKYKENEMRTHSLEAIELTIVELEKSNEKSQKLISENEKMSKRHHTEIQILLQDINVLEAVLQDKMNKQVDLVQSLKKEKQINYKLLNEPLSINTTTNNRFNTTRERLLDTPIQEVDEEDEEDDTYNNNCCALCDKKGHHLIHCNAITTY